MKKMKNNFLHKHTLSGSKWGKINTQKKSKNQFLKQKRNRENMLSKMLLPSENGKVLNMLSIFIVFHLSKLHFTKNDRHLFTLLLCDLLMPISLANFFFFHLSYNMSFNLLRITKRLAFDCFEVVTLEFFPVVISYAVLEFSLPSFL